MASGTKVRTLTRLLDAADAPVWAIGPTGSLVYLSAGVADWLGIDVELLVDRRSVAGSAATEDVFDRVAASLSPPPGLMERGSASLRIQPPDIDGRAIAPIDARFVRVGEGETSLALAIGGQFDDKPDQSIRDAVAVRERLDEWRKRHASIATMAAAGTSAAARRMRARLRVAASTRTHVGFFGPAGCGAESIAARIHQLSAPGESLCIIDGPLMDAELLDASVSATVDLLTHGPKSLASVLVRGLDEMPWEAQQLLAELIGKFSDRLRLLGLCGRQPAPLREPLPNAINQGIDSSVADEPTSGIHPKLTEVLASLTVTIEPLASRVEDIPLLAAAAFDAKQAAANVAADRFSRTALDALVMYPWPANFDELIEAVRQAARSAEGQSIKVEHLPLAIRSYRPGHPSGDAPTASISLDESIQQFERRLIEEAVEAAGGNRAGAARRLGISRTRLLRRLGDEAEK